MGSFSLASECVLNATTNQYGDDLRLPGFQDFVRSAGIENVFLNGLSSPKSSSSVSPTPLDYDTNSRNRRRGSIAKDEGDKVAEDVHKAESTATSDHSNQDFVRLFCTDIEPIEQVWRRESCKCSISQSRFTNVGGKVSRNADSRAADDKNHPNTSGLKRKSEYMDELKGHIMKIQSGWSQVCDRSIASQALSSSSHEVGCSGCLLNCTAQRENSISLAPDLHHLASAGASFDSQEDEKFHRIHLSPVTRINLLLQPFADSIKKLHKDKRHTGSGKSHLSKDLDQSGFHGTRKYNKHALDQELRFSADVNPIEVDSELTLHYLNTFFDHFNILMLDFLPRDPFMAWVTNCLSKDLPNGILLYALIACATSHSTEQRVIAQRAVFKAAIYQGLDNLDSWCCLRTAHILLLLAFTEYSDHQHQAGYRALERCVVTVKTLINNHKQIMQGDTEIYNLSQDAQLECCQRTFCAVICFNDHITLDDARPSILRGSLFFSELLISKDCCNQDRPRSSRQVGRIDKLVMPVKFDHTSTRSAMTHMLQITQLCVEVQDNAVVTEKIFRRFSRHMNHEPTRRELSTRLSYWFDKYGGTLQPEDSNVPSMMYQLNNSGQSTNGTRRCGGLDMLFYFAHMQLNRRMYHHNLKQREINAHARNATLHALDALGLVKRLVGPCGSTTKDFVFVSKGFFASHVIREAVEVITAVGRPSDILEPNSRLLSLLYGALDMLAHLGSQWGNEFVGYDKVKERIQLVYRSAQIASDKRKMYFYCSEAISGHISKEFDLIYGSDRKEYLKAAYQVEHPIVDEDVFEIRAGARDQG